MLHFSLDIHKDTSSRCQCFRANLELHAHVLAHLPKLRALSMHHGEAWRQGQLEDFQRASFMESLFKFGYERLGDLLLAVVEYAQCLHIRRQVFNDGRSTAERASFM